MIHKSELILNNDGSIFHLHLKPENIADRIILVGDQSRVDIIAGLLDKIELSVQNREFKSVTGWYNNCKITIISTGIGTDNIDIVLNELDALANIDLEKRKIKKNRRYLNIVRIGTTGALQSNIPVNSYIVTEKSIGFDGLLNFYSDRHRYCDIDFENAFINFTGWNKSLPEPYVVDASKSLAVKFNGPDFINGVTITAPGFYGPQGRTLRLKPAMPELISNIEKFKYKKWQITNFEMESSAIYGLSAMMGHKALTVCLVIANRITHEANENYREHMKKLVKTVMDNLAC